MSEARVEAPDPLFLEFQQPAQNAIVDPLEFAGKALLELKQQTPPVLIIEDETASSEPFQEDAVDLEDVPIGQEGPLPARLINNAKVIRDRAGIKALIDSPTIEHRDIKYTVAVDSVALFCQSVMAMPEEERQAEPALVQLYDKASKWLDKSLAWMTKRMTARYRANTRLSEEDMAQVVREQLFGELIPRFDPAKSSFLRFFEDNGWQELNYAVGKNATQLSTPQAFTSRSSGPEKNQALRSVSYDELAARRKSRLDIEGDLEGDTFVSPHLENRGIPETVITHERLRIIIGSIRSELTPLERRFLIEIRINGKPHEEIADLYGVNLKRVDNVLQRGLRKVRLRVAVYNDQS